MLDVGRVILIRKFFVLFSRVILILRSRDWNYVRGKMIFLGLNKEKEI